MKTMNVAVVLVACAVRLASLAAAAGDYRIARNSPCREKALKLGWMTAEATDLGGNPRVLDRYGKVSAAGLPDIGCYECASPILGLMLFVR